MNRPASEIQKGRFKQPTGQTAFLKQWALFTVTAVTLWARRLYLEGLRPLVVIQGAVLLPFLQTRVLMASWRSCIESLPSKPSSLPNWSALRSCVKKASEC